MPSKTSDRALKADRAGAICTPAQAEILRAYDHHRVQVNARVRVGDRSGVMLTYDWLMDAAPHDRYELVVVFEYADVHPAAPSDVQAVIDQLQFASIEE